MGAVDRINADYDKARVKWIEANGWMVTHGGALIWGVAGMIVGFCLGLLF